MRRVARLETGDWRLEGGLPTAARCPAEVRAPLESGGTNEPSVRSIFERLRTADGAGGKQPPKKGNLAY